jgi:hypothetical protein
VIFSGSFEWSVAFMRSDPKLLHLSRSCVQFLLFTKKPVLAIPCHSFASASMSVFSSLSSSSLLPLFFCGLGSLIIKLVRTVSSLIATMLGMWVREPLLAVK